MTLASWVYSSGGLFRCTLRLRASPYARPPTAPNPNTINSREDGSGTEETVTVRGPTAWRMPKGTVVAFVTRVRPGESQGETR